MILWVYDYFLVDELEKWGSNVSRLSAGIDRSDVIQVRPPGWETGCLALKKRGAANGDDFGAMPQLVILYKCA